MSEIDYDKIRYIQEGYELKIPLKHIPELTWEIYRDSIDYESLSKETQEIRKKEGKGCSEIELADGYFNMICNSDISLDSGTNMEKRGKWGVFFDDYIGIYWKIEDAQDLTLDYWVAWVLND